MPHSKLMHVVSFRVSDEEWAELEKRSLAMGYEHPSALIRDYCRSLLHGPEAVDSPLHKLELRMLDLQVRLQRLENAQSGSKPGRSGSDSDSAQPRSA